MDNELYDIIVANTKKAIAETNERAKNKFDIPENIEHIRKKSLEKKRVIVLNIDTNEFTVYNNIYEAQADTGLSIKTIKGYIGHYKAVKNCLWKYENY